MPDLLTPTGSLVNNIMSNSQQPTPVVGMGATELMHTDRHAATVVEVVNHRKIKVQLDFAERIDSNGQSECQSYRFAANPDAAIYTVTLRKNGRWVLVGEPSNNGRSFLIGHRDEYHDYSF